MKTVILAGGLGTRIAEGGFPLRPRPEDPNLVRFVTAWNSRMEDVEAFLRAASSATAVAA